MQFSIEIIDGPISGAGLHDVPDDAGAVVQFDGRVRGYENDVPIRGLTYEIYDAMAVREFERLIKQTMQRFEVLSMHVFHSRGFVAVGDCSFTLRITSMHRKPALEAMDWFINRMKQDVPIWKQAELR
jgi:molybdopterin synthase catalytic subunit